MENRCEKDEKEIQAAAAASDLYRLLSMSLLLPTTEIAAGLLDGSLAEDVLAIFDELNVPIRVLEKLELSFSQIPKNISEKVLLSELRREYTRLFTHPQKPLIEVYESLFLCQLQELDTKPSLFISPAALDAERCYEKAGVARSKELNEPGDYIVTEMEFMMFLNLQMAKALQEGNQEEAARREKEIREFYEVHLQKWAKKFFERCTVLSSHPFYRLIGEIGSSFIADQLPAQGEQGGQHDIH